MQNFIKKDLVSFALPAFAVFCLGLVVSTSGGYDGLTKALWHLIMHPEGLSQLSAYHAAGLILLVVGLTIALVAVFTLGRFYSSSLVTREDHRLITHGIYRFTRHPIYLGVLLVCFGPPVYASSLPAFLIMAILVPIFLNRIRIEEQMLTEEFGDAYRDYRKATSKLIPFMY